MSASLSVVAGLWAALLGRSSGGSDIDKNSWAASWIAGDAQYAAAAATGAVVGVPSSWLLIWMVAILGFLGLAYATNPSEASFRSHLTDLSFHLHLRRLRAHELESSSSTQLPGEYRHGPSPNAKSAADPSSRGVNGTLSSPPTAGNGHANDNCPNGKPATTTPAQSGGKGDKRSSSKTRSSAQSLQSNKNGTSTLQIGGTLEAQSSRSHVLSFSNRVSISLRTPSYAISNYAIISIARILPPASSVPAGVTSAPKAKQAPQAVSKKARKTAGKSASSGNAMADVSSSAAVKASSGTTLSPIVSREPWSAQGGLFFGFLGYWWTIDDGTSASGARERARLSNLVSAIEAEKDELPALSGTDEPITPISASHNNVNKKQQSSTAVPEVTENIVEEPASIESSTATTPTAIEASDQPTLQSTRNAKPPKSLTNGQGNATIRGGQRRSSPVPRGNSTGATSSKKKGQQQHQSASSGGASAAPATTSGESTPRTEGEAGQSGRTSQTSSVAHVRTVSSSNNGRADSVRTGEVGSDTPTNLEASAVKLGNADSEAEQQAAIRKKQLNPDEADISLVSHSASAAEAAVSVVTPAAALLQSQLDDLRASTAATQARLEAELSDLRSRNKDEDSVRAELKIRTKTLEEGKRSAEAARLEAERKLIAARGNKKSIEDRVGKTKAELGKLEKREKEIQEKLVKARVEREEKLAKLREEVKSREDVLLKEEEATLRLEDRVHALEVEIEDRKLELNNMREDQANAVAAAHQQQQQQQQLQIQQQQQQQQQQAQQQQQMQHAASAGQRTRAGSGRHPNAATPVVLNSSSSTSSSAAPPGLSTSSIRRNLSSTSSQNLGALFESHGAAAAAPPSTKGHPMFPFPDETLHRPPTPSKTPPGLAANRLPAIGKSDTMAAPGFASNANPSAYGGSSFLDHRSTRSAASANPASALYRRMHLGEDSGPTRFLGNGDEQKQQQDTSRASSGGFGHFAPFGPASPAPSDTSNGTATSPQIAKAGTNAPGDGYFGSASAVGAGAGAGNASPRKDSPGHTVPSPISPPSRYSTAGAAANADKQAVGDAAGVGSLAQNAGFGPLSPMTPHQASLIPSQLFDLLDDVQMPASPSPALSSSHGSASAGSHFPKSANGSPPAGHSKQFSSNAGAGASAWGDVGAEDFDFDKPLGGYYAGFGTGTGGVSRRTSGRNASSGYSPLLGDGSNNAFGPPGGGDSIFSLGHGHHGGSLSSIGTRSSSTGSVSPSLASAGQAAGGAPGSGKLSPNDLLLLEKARHAALSLNPDAKAFNFNRPLPSAASASSLASSGVKDPRIAFDAAAAGIPGQNPTWASPLLGNRGAPAGSAGGHGHSGQSQQQIRSASNPSTTAGSSFSPFDDDELLKRW